MGCTLQLIHPGRPMRGHPSQGWGHPGSLRGFLLSSGWEASWSHLPLTASRLKSSLLGPVGGTRWSQSSICPCSGAVKVAACPAGLDLSSSSSFADRVASTWIRTQARLLGLCKRMSAPPSACLVSRENGSGLNQQPKLKFSRLWSERTTSNHAQSIQLIARPDSVNGMQGWEMKTCIGSILYTQHWTIQFLDHFSLLAELISLSLPPTSTGLLSKKK